MTLRAYSSIFQRLHLLLFLVLLSCKSESEQSNAGESTAENTIMINVSNYKGSWVYLVVTDSVENIDELETDDNGVAYLNEDLYEEAMNQDYKIQLSYNGKLLNEDQFAMYQGIYTLDGDDIHLVSIYFVTNGIMNEEIRMQEALDNDDYIDQNLRKWVNASGAH